MGIEASISEATGKVNSHAPVVGSPEESDGVIVPEKLANNGSIFPGGADGGKAPDLEEVSKSRQAPGTDPTSPVDRHMLAT
jgi:hypothetical protein